MIKKLEHMALSVSDIQQSLAFYRDLLGFELVRELDCAPDSKLGEVVGMPGCAAKIAHLMCGETMLELFEYSDPRGTPTAESLRQADHAFVHIGLQSSDVRGDHKDLQSKGVKIYWKAVRESSMFEPTELNILAKLKKDLSVIADSGLEV